MMMMILAMMMMMMMMMMMSHSSWCGSNAVYPQFDAFFGPRRRFAPRLAHESQPESHETLLLNTEVFTLRFFTEKLLHKVAFTQSNFYTQKHLHTEAFTHISLYTEKTLLKSPFPHKAFSCFFKQELLHKKTSTHRTLTHRCPRFYTQDLLFTHTHTHAHSIAFIQRNFTHKHSYSLYTRKLLHRKTCTKQKLFTHRSFYSEKPVNRAALYTEAFTHTHTQKKTLSSLYTQQLWHTHTHKLLFFRTHTRLYAKELCTWAKELCTNSFTHSSFRTEKPIYGPAFALRRFCTQAPVHKEALT